MRVPCLFLQKEKDLKKQKFYVVWVGKKPGIYTDWDSCKAQVTGALGARFKSYESAEEAQAAYARPPAPATHARTKALLTPAVGGPTHHCICVDAACNGTNGDMEYQGVLYPSGQLLFKKGVYKNATNNIGEFLAIVHALAFLEKNQKNLPIYSDSKIAISWVAQKCAKSKLIATPENETVFDLIYRAEVWLQNRTKTPPILKWQTKLWGENPADFGRK